MQKFGVGNESTGYTLQVGYMLDLGLGITIAIGSSFNMLNGMKFSTMDVDNDLSPGDCANSFGNSGWWFKQCGLINLNGRFGPGHGGNSGITCQIIGDGENLLSSRMLVRRM